MSGAAPLPLTLATRLRPSPACAHQRFGTEGLILVPLKRRQHFLKNETATWIWSRIEEGRTLGEIRDGMVERYEVEPEAAERDLLDLCRRLLEEEAVEAC